MKYRFLIIAMVLFSLFLGGTTTKAMAQGRRWTFDLASLGAPEPLVLAGPIAEQPLSVPVPRGLRPVRLFARARVSPEAIGSVLAIAQDERTIQWIRLTLSEMRLAIPLEEARVRGDRLILSWRLQASELSTDCAAPEQLRVELDRMEVDMEGELEPPERVAEFWPPVLRVLHLQLPDPPSLEEATAALRLAALGARLAEGGPLTITVRPASVSFHPPEDPWARGVRLASGPIPQLALRLPEGSRMPLLEITGPPSSLSASVEALAAYLKGMQASEVSALEGSFSLPSGGNQVTLAALGYPQIQMSGSGPMEARIFFAQADLGGPTRGIHLRLAGRISPIPLGGQAQLLVLLNGGLIYGEPLAGGSFDRWIALPDGLLQRDNTLTLRIVYTPPGGECRVGVHPLTVFIEGASYFQFQRGTHLPSGFERLPQGLLPAFTVGLDPLNLETMEAAAQLIAALQRTTRTALVPQVRSWEETLTTPGPLLLIALDPEKVLPLRPPLDPRPFRVIDVDGRERFRMEIGQSFAVLQAFTDGEREILLLTRRGGRPDLRGLGQALDPALGWYGLSGDVWIWPDGALPIAMRLRGGGLHVAPLPPSPTIEWPRIRFWVAGAALIAVVGFLIWIYPRLVRSGPPGTPQP